MSDFDMIKQLRRKRMLRRLERAQGDASRLNVRDRALLSEPGGARDVRAVLDGEALVEAALRQLQAPQPSQQLEARVVTAYRAAARPSGSAAEWFGDFFPLRRRVRIPFAVICAALSAGMGVSASYALSPAPDPEDQLIAYLAQPVSPFEERHDR